MSSCRQIIVVFRSMRESLSIKKVTLISQGYKPFKFENAGFYSHSIINSEDNILKQKGVKITLFGFYRHFYRQ